MNCDLIDPFCSYVPLGCHKAATPYSAHSIFASYKIKIFEQVYLNHPNALEPPYATSSQKDRMDWRPVACTTKNSNLRHFIAQTGVTAKYIYHL